MGLRVLVVVPTTGGPLLLRGLKPRAGLPRSAAFADGDYRPLPWSGDYAGLSAPDGPLARLLPPAALVPHELRLSGSFDTGRSWEVPVALAHGLLARGHAVAAAAAEADLALWSTGAVDLDLALIAGDYALLDKVEASRALLGGFPAALPLAILLPPGRHREAAARALSERPGGSPPRMVEAATIEAALDGIVPPEHAAPGRAERRRRGLLLAVAALAGVTVAAAAGGYAAVRVGQLGSSASTPSTSPAAPAISATPVAVPPASPSASAPPPSAAPTPPSTSAGSPSGSPSASAATPSFPIPPSASAAPPSAPAPVPTTSALTPSVPAVPASAPPVPSSAPPVSPSSSAALPSAPLAPPSTSLVSVPLPGTVPTASPPASADSPTAGSGRPPASPVAPLPVRAAAEPPVRAALALEELHAPAGSSCRRVAFGAVAPDRRPVALAGERAFAPTRLVPGLCGLVFHPARGSSGSIAIGAALAAVALPPERRPDGSVTVYLRDALHRNVVYDAQVSATGSRQTFTQELQP